MTVKYIFNKAHEDEALRSEKAVICFSAPWCVPCQTFSPTYSQIADDNKHIHFYKIDVDESQEFTDLFKIQSIPAFIFIKNGEKINEIIGVNEQKFLSLLQEL
jgi:thioredoxin 1